MRYETSSGPRNDISISSGCFMMCRTSALYEVSGFDQNYFLYFEDFDLSLRIRRVGEIAYVPNVRIVHRGGKTANKGITHILMFCRSAVRFFKTYGWKWI